MRHFALVLGLASALPAACPATTGVGQDCVDHLHYFKASTGLCFATCGMAENFSVTNVPCSKEVLDAARKEDR